MPYNAQQALEAFQVPDGAPIPITKTKKGASKPAASPTKIAKPKFVIKRYTPSVAHVTSALRSVDASNRDTWFETLCGLKESYGDEIGFGIAYGWSVTAPECFDPVDLARVWKSIKRSEGRRATAQTIIHKAKDNGWYDVEYDCFADLFPPNYRANDNVAPLKQTGGVLTRSLKSASLDELKKAASLQLFKGLMSPQDQFMLYGESTAGKTFLGMDLALHLAGGKDWHGYKVKRRRPVLYVTLEGRAGFDGRMLSLSTVDKDVDDYFRVLNPHISLNKADVGAEGLKQVLAACKEAEVICGEPVGLVVIDTLARAMAGDDENAVADMMHYLDHRAGEIARQTGAAVLTVHHTNKNGQIRGSSAAMPAVDGLLRADDGTLYAEKIKDGVTGAMFDYTLRIVDLGLDEDQAMMTSCVINTSPATGVARAGGNKRVPKVPESERLLRAAFRTLENDGMASFDPETETYRFDLDMVRKEFNRRYAEPDGKGRTRAKEGARSVWSRILKSPPHGFDVIDRDGVEVMTRFRDPFESLL